MLTETLRGMQNDGLVERRILKQTAPQHVEYALSELGKTLQEPLAAICAARPSTVTAAERVSCGASEVPVAHGRVRS